MSHLQFHFTSFVCNHVFTFQTSMCYRHRPPGGLWRSFCWLYKKQGSTFPSIHPSIADSSKAEKLGIIAGALRNWQQVASPFMRWLAMPRAPWKDKNGSDMGVAAELCTVPWKETQGGRKRPHMLRSVKWKVDISYRPPTLKWAGEVGQNSNNHRYSGCFSCTSDRCHYGKKLLLQAV